MKPIVIARGESKPVNDPHAEARITEPVVTLPDDYTLKATCEVLLNPTERRRFRYLHAEATRNGAGVRPAIRLALRRMHDECTERVDRALERVRR